jgi:transcription termination factor Rho
MDTIDRSTLEGKLLPELQQIAQTMGIEGSQRLRKAGLIDAIVEASSNGERPGHGEASASSSRESSVAMGAVSTEADGAVATDAVATAESGPESATRETVQGSACR